MKQSQDTSNPKEKKTSEDKKSQKQGYKTKEDSSKKVEKTEKKKKPEEDNKAIKYRIYPSEQQKALFAQTFGCCRKIYNLMLADKIDNYQLTKSFGNQTPAQYKEEFPFLREVDSLALANVQLDLQQAMKNHFDNPQHFGFPKFKSRKKCRKSYTTNNQSGTISIENGKIKLPKLGWVKAAIHRMPGPDWRLKSATVSQDGDGKYYASVLFAFKKKAINKVTVDTVPPEKVLGLDYKSDGLYMDNNGHCADMPKYYWESHNRLAKEQHRLSRKKGGRKGETPSNNYLKQKMKVAKVHKHIANQRMDYLHKLSTEIANQYDIVCVESLNMKAIANNGFHNGKATMDNGYGMFLNMLEYKLKERGKNFVKVDKFFPSSQLCSKCGNRKKLTLTERVYTCSCGAVMDRDHNAAINIRNEGLRILQNQAAS